MYKFEILDINEDQALFSQEFTTAKTPVFDIITDEMVGCNHHIKDRWTLISAVEMFLSYHPNVEELILSVSEDGEVMVDIEAGNMSISHFLSRAEDMLYEPYYGEKDED